MLVLHMTVADIVVVVVVLVVVLAVLVIVVVGLVMVVLVVVLLSRRRSSRGGGHAFSSARGSSCSARGAQRSSGHVGDARAGVRAERARAPAGACGAMTPVHKRLCKAAFTRVLCMY